jgi:hypothetical protein
MEILYENIRKNQIKKVIQMGFNSTSYNVKEPEALEAFRGLDCCGYYILIKAETPIMVIPSSISGFRDEKEILLPVGTVFSYLNCQFDVRDNNYVQVDHYVVRADQMKKGKLIITGKEGPISKNNIPEGSIIYNADNNTYIIYNLQK